MKNDYLDFLVRITIIFIFLLFILLMVGCRTKKEYIETHTTDTIHTKEILKITKPQLNEITIDNICDSLGQLKVINYTNISSNSKTSLKTHKNSLILTVNIDSIVNSELEKYKSSIKTSDKLEIIEVTPKWAWKFIIISGLLNLLLLIWTFKKPLIRMIKPI